MQLNFHDATVCIKPHAIILACCKPGFRPVCSQVFDKFVRVCDTLSKLRPAVRLFFRKPGRELQQVGRFVRVLDKWNVEKTVLSKFAAGFRHAFDLHATRFSTRFAAGSNNEMRPIVYTGHNIRRPSRLTIALQRRADESPRNLIGT